MLGARFCSFSRGSKTKSAGSALVYTFLTVGVMLSIVLFMSSVFAIKLRLSLDTANSVTAFYAADSALEWQLYNSLNDPDASEPVLTNGAVFVITSPPGTLPIKVTGKFQGTSRAVEVSF